jgi:hypothetical protein
MFTGMHAFIKHSVVEPDPYGDGAIIMIQFSAPALAPAPCYWLGIIQY